MCPPLMLVTCLQVGRCLRCRCRCRHHWWSITEDVHALISKSQPVWRAGVDLEVGGGHCIRQCSEGGHTLLSFFHLASWWHNDLWRGLIGDGVFMLFSCYERYKVLMFEHDTRGIIFFWVMPWLYTACHCLLSHCTCPPHGCCPCLPGRSCLCAFSGRWRMTVMQTAFIHPFLAHRNEALAVFSASAFRQAITVDQDVCMYHWAAVPLHVCRTMPSPW